MSGVLAHLFTAQRATHASGVAIGALVVANAIPLIGVLFLGWSLPAILGIYWAENGVIGVFAFLRILTADGPVPSVAPPPSPLEGRPVAVLPASIGRMIMAPFFAVHYGIFWVGHGVFVLLFLPMMLSFGGGGVLDPSGMTAAPAVPVILQALPFLVASHALSFWLNWVVAGERHASNPTAEMFAPYARVMLLHVTIIGGAFAVVLLGKPIWALVVMVAFKTGMDLRAHLAERRRAAGRAGSVGVQLRVRGS